MAHPQILRDMALFVEVAKRLSFSQAARALDMPISSLSRRITLFEAAVGLRLLDRTTRKIVLTTYGEAYLAQATRLVEEAERSFDDLIAQARGPSGLLKIAAPPDYWVLRHLSGIIGEFSREHEHIHLHIDLKLPPIDIAGDNYDLAIMIEEPRESSLIVRKIADVENGLYAAPSYLAAHGIPTGPHNLKAHQVILPNQGASGQWRMTCGERNETVPFKGPISCNSLSLARQFAVNGQGITTANVIQVAQDVQEGRLQRVLPEWRLTPTPIFIVTTSRLLPAKARSFIDVVTRRLGAVLIAASRSDRDADDASRGEGEIVPLRALARNI